MIKLQSNTTHTKNTLKIIWLLSAFYFLVYFLLNPDSWNNNELRQMLFIGVSILTLPSGYLLGVIADFITPDQWPKTKLIFSIIVMILGGYYQWFVFLPRLWKKFKKGS